MTDLFGHNPVQHTVASMDEMIRTVAKHRGKLMKQGHIDHFGQIVRPQAQEAAQPEPVTHDSYCLKCKGKKKVETKKVEVHSNGAHRAVGPCPDCGTETHAMKSADEGKKLKDALESNRAYTGGV